MNDFVPTRKIKEKEDVVRKIKEKQLEQFLTQSQNYEKKLKEKILSDYVNNDNFKKIFEEIEKDDKDKKEVLNLAQFKRFHDFVKEKEYDFFDDDESLKNFIEKQLDRGYAETFYVFIWNEFCYEIPKNKLKNKAKLEIRKIGKLEVKNLIKDNIKSIKANGNLKNEIKGEIELKLKIFEKYLLYVLGKKELKG